MIAAVEERLSLENLHEAFELQATRRNPMLKEYGTQAFERFLQIGFPSSRQEDWKYINLEPLLKAKLKIAVDQEVCQSQKQALIKQLPDGVKILTLNELLDPKQKELVEICVKEASCSQDPFVLLNLSLLQDIYILHVSLEAQAERPIEINLLSGIVDRQISQFKLIVVCETHSKSNLIIKSTGQSELGVYLNNWTADFHLQAGSHLNLTMVQHEALTAFQMANSHFQLNKHACLQFNNFALGGRFSRHKITVDLLEEGCQAELNGLYVLSEDSCSYNQLSIVHHKGHTISQQLYKGILDDEAQAEFSGSINVAKNAIGTNARQLNKNLLLSPKAKVDSRPQFQIQADDVKCSHGATISQLEEDQIFYLLSRGLEKKQAKQLLTYGFAEEIIEKVPCKELRHKLDQLFLNRLKKPNMRTSL